MLDELGEIALGEALHDLGAILRKFKDFKDSIAKPLTSKYLRRGLGIGLGGVNVVDLGLVDGPRAGVDVDLDVEHLGGEVVAAVDGRGHELEPDLPPDRLQPLRHASRGTKEKTKSYDEFTTYMRVCIELNVPDGDFLLQEVETFLEDGLLLDVDGEPAVEQDGSRGLGELGERPELRALGADAV